MSQAPSPMIDDIVNHALQELGTAYKYEQPQKNKKSFEFADKPDTGSKE